jgi:hypothetical protein
LLRTVNRKRNGQGLSRQFHPPKCQQIVQGPKKAALECCLRAMDFLRTLCCQHNQTREVGSSSTDSSFRKMTCFIRISRIFDVSSSDKTRLFCSRSVLSAALAFFDFFDFLTCDLWSSFRVKHDWTHSSCSPQAASSVNAADAEKKPQVPTVVSTD